MKEPVFHFKQFDVWHTHAAMKVGTDGVLLGLLAQVDGAQHILDIGTGSGLVALLLAQRNKEAQIWGVDIEPDAARQAADNFKGSPWAERLKSVCCDINLFQAEVRYDLIVSNPPYYEHSPKTFSESRDKARLTVTLNHAQLIEVAARWLAPAGRFAVVLPSTVSEDFIFQCWQQNLFLQEQVQICTKKGKPCKRMVLTFTKTRELVQTRDLVLMGDNGQRSEAYQTLSLDYFVK